MFSGVKEFLAFEWLMLLIIGFFWAAAMAFPLYLSAFENKAALLENILILTGPYLVYLVVRFLWLLWRSILWAYLTSNFFFTSAREKILAEEWMKFVFLGLLWMVCISIPMYLTGMFTEQGEMIRNLVILFAAYIMYLLAKGVLYFLESIGWAVFVVSKGVPISPKKRRK